MIYFDNGATTKAYPECIKIIEKYLVEDFYNPSALYHNAIQVSKNLALVREKMLKRLNANENDNFIYTASGSEADNLALLCVRKRKNGTIIISNSEHSAIYQCAKELEREGYNVLYAPVDKSGRVIISKFEKLLSKDVCLVSVMHVNNETGCINDIETISKLTKKYSPKAIIHSDGVQAFGKLKINVRKLGVDLYSISGHKIHAPKGIGGLYVKNGISLKPIIYGGGQEFNIRSATENIPYIMALDYASDTVYDNFENKYFIKMSILEYIKNEIMSNIKDVICLTPEENHSSHVLAFAFKDIRGEVLMHSLEEDGFIVGIGSACSAHHSTGRIQQAIGLEKEYERGVIRISFSEFNTLDEAKSLAKAIIKNVNNLRIFIQK